MSATTSGCSFLINKATANVTALWIGQGVGVHLLEHHYCANNSNYAYNQTPGTTNDASNIALLAHLAQSGIL